MNKVFLAPRRALGASVAALLLSLPASSASAQVAAPADARWQPFVGCWAPTVGQTTTVTDAATPQVLCVVPVDGGASAELASIANGQVVERERIEPTGTRRPITREGCTGFETVKFSSDNQRVYLQTDLMCSGDIRRSSTGLIAMASANEWLDIQTVNVGDAKALRVVRYRSVTPENLPAEIASALPSQSSLAVSTARIAASSPISVDDVLEVSSNVDAPAVEAWLIERKPEFSLDAKAIAALGDVALPPGVVDLMVALAYPERFADVLNDRSGALRPAQLVVSQANAPVMTPVGYGDPFYWDRYRSSRYGSYYYSPYGYSRYGLSRNGYGIGYGGYSTGYYNRPQVIVVNPSELQSNSGSMVKGSGYRPGRNARPSTSVGRSSGSSGSSSGSSGSSSSGGSSSGGSSSGSTGRVAVPKTPPPAE